MIKKHVRVNPGEAIREITPGFSKEGERHADETSLYNRGQTLTYLKEIPGTKTERRRATRTQVERGSVQKRQNEDDGSEQTVREKSY